MQIGKTGINVEALADISKDEFAKLLVGEPKVDLEKEWKEFKVKAKPFKKTKKSSSK